MNFSRRKIGHAHDNSADSENVAGVREPNVHAYFISRFENSKGNQNTMIHSGTLCIQRKVTKFPCLGGLVFRAQFQHFLSAFWRSFLLCC